MNFKLYWSLRAQPIVACFLLSGFVICWYLLLNPYLSFTYREQSQMFLFSQDYFLNYLNLPGGLTSYASSFLIQFFYYRLLGAMVYLGIFLWIYATFKRVLRKLSLVDNSFFIAFIPGLLFLPASSYLLFDIADEIAVIIVLYGFISLSKLVQNRFYYVLIPLCITILYVLAGGNVLLSLTLLLISPLPSFQRKLRNEIKLIAVFSLFIPLILWHFFYLHSFMDTCYTLTPFRYPDVQFYDFRVFGCLSVVAIPVIGMLFKNIRTGKKWIFIGNILLAVAILIVIVREYRPDFDNIIKMGLDAENHRWEDIIATSKKTSVSPLNCFYTNLALQKTGQMAEKMFNYEQIGTSGLFLDLEDHLSCQAKSEWFYQMGLINAAQHFSFESLVGYSHIKEPNIRNMKRLLDYAVIRQDSCLSAKYEKILNKTLFYNKEQRIYPCYPIPIRMKDIFIRDMPVLLESIMEDNSDNQAIFEYLMAYYLLERNYDQAKKCYDRYYSNFHYSHIPVHYAEFLTLYKRIKNVDDSFYEQYPVSKEIRERFDMIDILLSTQMTKQIQKALEDGFKNTYWFYVKFPLINVQAANKDEKNIY